MRDVVYLRRRRRNGAAQNFLEARTINTWPEPIRTEILRGCEVVFPRVLHRKRFGERTAEAGEEPIGIVLDRALGGASLFDKITDHLDDEFIRHAPEMQLNGMLRPESAPIIVEVNLNGFEFLVDAVRKQGLNASVFGERNMRP